MEGVGYQKGYGLFFQKKFPAQIVKEQENIKSFLKNMRMTLNGSTIISNNDHLNTA